MGLEVANSPRSSLEDRIEVEVVTASEGADFEEFVAHHPDGNPFQTFGMLELYEGTLAGKPLALRASLGGTTVGTLVGVTFTEVSPLLSSLSSHATVRLGPLVARVKNRPEIFQALLQAYQLHAEGSPLYIRVYPPGLDEDLSHAAGSLGFRREGWLDYVIRLDRTEEAIWKGIKKVKRSAIRGAERQGLEFKEVEDDKALHRLYEVLAQSHRRAGIPVQNEEFFAKALKTMGSKGLIRFFGVVHEGAFIAACVVLTYRDMLYYWYAGFSLAAQRYRPNDLMVWRVLQWGREQQRKRFVFGGAGNPDEPYGVRDFKRRFGGQEVDYGHLTKVLQPTQYGVARRLFRIYRRFRRL